MIRRLLWLAVASGVVAMATVATAAPRVTPAATRGELSSWLVELRAEGSPREWLYWFVGGDEQRVEALSLTLVAAGFAIVRLGRVDGDVELVVARLELHTPTSLARRQADLSVMARRGGMRYLGVDAR